MTEAEWLACRDPARMLEYLKPLEAARKSQLFKCACCRIVWWSLLIDPRSRAGVEVAERRADEASSSVEVNSATEAAQEAEFAWRLQRGAPGDEDLRCARSFAAVMAVDTTANTGYSVVGIARLAVKVLTHAARGKLRPEAKESRGNKQARSGRRWMSATLCKVARDIFGNPFRPVTFSPEWRTSTAVAIAKEMYESRDFAAMPILADALQDAGCDNADLLDHCRDVKATHIRGCWVVDSVLGKV